MYKLENSEIRTGNKFFILYSNALIVHIFGSFYICYECFGLSLTPNHQKVEENMEPDANTFLTAQILNDGKLVSQAS